VIRLLQNGRERDITAERLTRIFLNATNTLGVETTATVMSAVAPSSSILAYSPAVSSAYYVDPSSAPSSPFSFSFSSRIGGGGGWGVLEWVRIAG
jgi:hypothetical protein